METNLVYNSLEEIKKNLFSEEERINYDLLKIKRDIINIILEYRKVNKVTQKELAIKLNTTQQAISRLEKNEINPTIEFVARALFILGFELKIKKCYSSSK